jgi:2-polyprenyl-3-methyl-5-hydroxy-6-metoxy-1,4-benzoquinol methylase
MPFVGASLAGGLLAESLAKTGKYISAANAATFNNMHNIGVVGVVTAAVGCAIFYINYKRTAIESLDRTFKEKLLYSFGQL